MGATVLLCETATNILNLGSAEGHIQECGFATYVDSHRSNMPFGSFVVLTV